MLNLLKTLLESLKWCVAGKEMETLSRYRIYMEESRRWFAESDDASDALNYLEGMAENRPDHRPISIDIWRHAMRERRRRIFETLRILQKAALQNRAHNN